ncbi:beta-lactamase [Anopheles sinensis]|uniref:Beta-lactamase n=1 Tax=Anopheles sinensis TaxID=74873 RepID=A0A084W592_ANOSI|nr:beta-lactamase [Anopheles sinensis]
MTQAMDGSIPRNTATAKTLHDRRTNMFLISFTIKFNHQQWQARYELGNRVRAARVITIIRRLSIIIPLMDLFSLACRHPALSPPLESEDTRVCVRESVRSERCAENATNSSGRRRAYADVC